MKPMIFVGGLWSIAALGGLGACHSEQTRERIRNGDVDAAPSALSSAAKAAPLPGLIDARDDLVDFHVGWSAEAAAIPALVARFTAAAAKDKTELLDNARAEKLFRDKEKFDFHPLESQTDYATAGQSARLLSLVASWSAFTGGAHPNHGTRGLLWDRQAGREIPAAALFSAPGARDALLRAPFCAELDRQRRAKRGGERAGLADFDACPPLDDVAVVPTDANKDGRFEAWVMTADPYVAGPYAEGDYEVDLPVLAAAVGALKAEFRDSFQPQ